MEGDGQRFRAVMGHFATGVTVVTALDGGRAVGMTTNAVCSLSLDPLLVLVCFDNSARTLSVVRVTGRFAVNVLRAGEEELSGQFASKLPVEEKFELVAHSTRHEVPILDSALAWVACELRELVEGGDHTVGIGAVVGMDHADGEPLVWFRGAYTTVAPPR
jgi:3-hydroxy-9,10-secoandrosta-1,3,5(10)-triene-9,17-dione monooxygenase reductase component